MIVVVVAAVIGVAAFVLLWRELAAPNRPRKLSKIAAASAGILIAVLLVLTATGRLHWLAALIAGILPFARWVLGLLIGPLIGNLLRSGFAFNRFRTQSSASAGFDRSGSGRTSGQASSVATADLRMTLDHETGDMDGEVLAGNLAGERLSTLDLAALTALYNDLAGDDSRQLLGAYLDRRFPGWTDASTRREAPACPSEMDESQALAVLGLAAGATEAEVREAHRRLMQKLHPDRGGSDYLAATLNRAKEVLIGG